MNIEDQLKTAEQTLRCLGFHRKGNGYSQTEFIKLGAPDAAPVPVQPGHGAAAPMEEGAVYRDNIDGGLFVCASSIPDSQKDVPVVNFDGSCGFVDWQLCKGTEKVAHSISEYFSLKLNIPPAISPTGVSEETRKEIIKAFEADMNQFFTDSLTPDRGYSVSVDNLADLFACALAKHRASDLRIYTRCPSCHNTTLTINEDKHLLCTWIECKDPTLIDRDDRASDPFIVAAKKACELATKGYLAEASYRDRLMEISDVLRDAVEATPNASDPTLLNAAKAALPLVGHICRDCWDAGCDMGATCRCPCHTFHCPQRDVLRSAIESAPCASDPTDTEMLDWLEGMADNRTGDIVKIAKFSNGEVHVALGFKNLAIAQRLRLAITAAIAKEDQ